MEFGTREILIGLGALVVLAILLDGVRRVRNARRGSLRTGRSRQPVFDERDDLSELPSGSARIVAYRDDDSAEQVSQKIRDAAAKSRLQLRAPRVPEQVALNLGETEGALDHIAVPSVEAPRAPRKKADPKPVVKPPSPAAAAPADVVVLHAMAPRGDTFAGQQLLDAVLAQGLRYGARRIFHRHDSDDGSGPILFSMANAVKPGDFELDRMDEFTTPGVSFLMILQDAEDPLATFNRMYDTATTISERLGGELKDETRSALTPQTVEHYRQRITEYTRRQIAGYH